MLTIGGGGRKVLPDAVIPPSLPLGADEGLVEMTPMRGGGGRPPKDFNTLVVEEEDAVAIAGATAPTEVDSPPGVVLPGLPKDGVFAPLSGTMASEEDPCVFPERAAEAAAA